MPLSVDTVRVYVVSSKWTNVQRDEKNNIGRGFLYWDYYCTHKER
jgi:hypothetical protein